MRSNLAALVASIFTLQAGFAADEKSVEYGKYICVTDRAVGFMRPEPTAEPYAGAIQMSPQKQKFFVTLRKVEKVVPTDMNWIRNGSPQHVSERCFGKENIENLDRQWQRGGINYNGPNVEDFDEWCLARSTAEIVGDDLPEKYYSLGINIFQDRFANRFWIYNGWEFIWTYTGIRHSSYMLEGRCELIR